MSSETLGEEVLLACPATWGTEGLIPTSGTRGAEGWGCPSPTKEKK